MVPTAVGDYLVRILILGASGGLAASLADVFLERGCSVDLVTREMKRERVERRYPSAIAAGLARVFAVRSRYSDFDPPQSYDVCFFTPALFSPRPLTSMDDAGIEGELNVGLTDPICLTRKLLARNAPAPGERRNYCYIGSTSAYAGFRDTAVYCAVKHGLLGFVRAMNDEYAQTDVRFWLFSMGAMDTEMGAKLTDQDPSSFLQPGDVARRIAEVVCSPSNLFEPEVLIRRRTIRFREKQSTCRHAS